MKTNPFINTFSLVTALIILSGCSSMDVLKPKSDLSEFYILDSEYSLEEVAMLNPDGVAVLIGPTTIAKYLDQPQIVTTPGKNRLDYSETHRWGESLTEGINRLLLDAVAIDLETARATFQRINRNFEWDYRVGYHVYQLSGPLDEYVELQVAWWISTKEGKQQQFEGSLYKTEVSGEGNDYEAYVQAIEASIKAWSADVAKAIKQL